MFRKREKGQSLIEVTFFLIILLILVAGIVEVGAILQTKLTVVNSAREGARFGAVGASDDDITLVTQTSASSILNYTDENADIWVIRAKTSTGGTVADSCPSDLDAASSYWCVSHEVGDGPEEPTFLTYDLVSNSQNGLLYGIKDTEYIAVAISYDHQSIIGLPYAVGGGGMPVNSYTLMRMESNEEYAGCYTWPIAVHTDTVDWYGVDGTPGHPKNTPLGDIYNGAGSGNFGWLRWNDDKGGNPASNSQQALAERLNNPQTSLSEFKNAANNEDTHLSVGDWVYGDEGVSIGKDVKDAINDLEGQRIRILVWDQSGGGSPSDGSPGECKGDNCSYHVVGFALVVLTDLDGDGKIFDPSGKDKTIEAKFIGFDDSCQ